MLDDELRSLVTVDPDAGFEARVRRRVAERGAARRWRSTTASRPFAAAGLVVVLATAIVLVSREAPQHRAIAETVPLTARPLTTPVVLHAAVVPSRRVPGRSDPESCAADPCTIDGLTPPVRVGVPSRPDVQIDPLEARALRELFRTSARLAPSPMSKPVPATIVIPELSIAPLDTGAGSKGDLQ